MNAFHSSKGAINIIFRQEHPDDYEQTEQLIKEAFKNTPVRSGSEHRMVRKLRKEATFKPAYSRVALKNNEVIGHVIVSEVHIINGPMKTPILNLGLVTVSPHEQRQGIGKQLIHHVLSIARNEGHEAIIVFGHPTYYPKIGFKRASTWGIELPFEAPDDCFFALELVPHALRETTGIVEYSPAFFGE